MPETFRCSVYGCRADDRREAPAFTITLEPAGRHSPAWSARMAVALGGAHFEQLANGDVPVMLVEVE